MYAFLTILNNERVTEREIVQSIIEVHFKYLFTYCMSDIQYTVKNEIQGEMKAACSFVSLIEVTVKCLFSLCR